MARPPRLFRVRLWQAVAGMCVAITIWLLIVMSELTGRVVRQSHYMDRRVATLNATVRSLRHQTASEQRKLGSVRERASVGEVFEKILFASDLKTFKLVAPMREGPGKRKIGAASSWRRSSGRQTCDERVGRLRDARSKRAPADRPFPGLPDLVDAETWCADLGCGFFSWR